MADNLDSLGVEKSLEKFPDQVKEAWQQAQSVSLPPARAGKVIIAGMGGSSLAGRIIAGLFENELEKQIYIHNDYGLPAWADKNSLVIGNSYSGNTEETISSVDTALKKGCPVVALSTNGTLIQRSQKGEFPAVKLSPTTNLTGFPKTGLGVSLGGLLGVLSNLKIIPLRQEDLFGALEDLLKVRQNWPAEELAKWFQNGLPVFFVARPFIGSAHAGRNVMAEIGRTFNLHFDFPEVDHFLIEATQLPEIIHEKARYLYLNSDFYHPRVKLRYRITQDLFEEQALTFKNYDLQTKTKLAQALEIPHFCAWVAFHLSLLNGKDPGPEPWILKLKKELS